MATITLKVDALPQATDSVTFSFGSTEFVLGPAGTFETKDPNVIYDAKAHPWLEVELDTVDPASVPQPDLTDPHQNPAADHLSSVASPEAVAAAEAANQAILDAVTPVTSPPPAPAAVQAPVPAAPAPVPAAPAPDPVVEPAAEVTA